MSMYLSEEMIPFYLQGRGAKLTRIKKYVADPEEIAETIEGGKAKVRDAIGKACSEAAEQLMGDRKRKAVWLEENSAELANVDVMLGGKVNTDEAWKAFCYGMGDELAYAMEPDVLDVLEDPDGEGDEDGDDDGDDGDDKDDSDKPS